MLLFAFYSPIILWGIALSLPFYIGFKAAKFRFRIDRPTSRIVSLLFDWKFLCRSARGTHGMVRLELNSAGRTWYEARKARIGNFAVTLWKMRGYPGFKTAEIS